MSYALIQPRRAQWLFLAITLFIVFPIVVVLVAPDDVSVALIRRYELPEIQKSLGFTLGLVTPPSTSGTGRPIVAVTSVERNGPFWTAGVRPGDAPTGYYHGAEKGLLWDLVWGKPRGSVQLRFTPAEAWAKGDWHVEHKVTVHYPHP